MGRDNLMVKLRGKKLSSNYKGFVNSLNQSGFNLQGVHPVVLAYTFSIFRQNTTIINPFAHVM
jgi:hypothetical protein